MVFDVLLVSWDPKMFKSQLFFHGYVACLSHIAHRRPLFHQDMDKGHVSRRISSCVPTHYHLSLGRSSLSGPTARNFQARLSVRSDEEADIWVLLTRHVVDTKNRKDEYISLDVEVEDERRTHDTGLTVCA